MNKYLVPKYLLPFITIVFILSFLTISSKNQAPRGLYAICEGKRIVLSGNLVILNKTPYKVRKIFLTDRVVWNRHAEHCTGGNNPFYQNTFRSFEWDMDSKKAKFYQSSAVSSFTNQCTILDAPPPDWVVISDYIKRKPINLDCS